MRKGIIENRLYIFTDKVIKLRTNSPNSNITQKNINNMTCFGGTGDITGVFNHACTLEHAGKPLILIQSSSST